MGQLVDDSPAQWLEILSAKRDVGNCTHMGLSENSVPLHPMVNDHYPY